MQLTISGFLLLTVFILSPICLVLASCELTSAYVDGDRAFYVPRCGAPVPEDSVTMIDLQTLDYDSETLVERFGAFEQVTDRPVALSTRASGVPVVPHGLSP